MEHEFHEMLWQRAFTPFLTNLNDSKERNFDPRCNFSWTYVHLPATEREKGCDSNWRYSHKLQDVGNEPWQKKIQRLHMFQHGQNWHSAALGHKQIGWSFIQSHRSSNLFTYSPDLVNDANAWKISFTAALNRNTHNQLFPSTSIDILRKSFTQNNHNRCTSLAEIAKDKKRWLHIQQATKRQNRLSSMAFPTTENRPSEQLVSTSKWIPRPKQRNCMPLEQAISRHNHPFDSPLSKKPREC